MVLHIRKSLFMPSLMPDYLVLVWNMALFVPMAVPTKAAVCAFWLKRAVADVCPHCSLISAALLPLGLARRGKNSYDLKSEKAEVL